MHCLHQRGATGEHPRFEHLRLSYSKEIDSLSVQSLCLQGQIFPGLKGDIIILKCRPIKEKKSQKIML